MSRSALTLQALVERIARPQRAWRNRLRAYSAGLGGRAQAAARLPEPVLLGDAGRGEALLAGRWQALGHEVPTANEAIWTARLPDPRL